MKINKEIARIFIKEGGIISFFLNTGLIYLTKSAITKNFDLWSLLLSASVSFFIFYITNYLTIQSKKNLMDQSIKINFNTESNLSIIKQHVILYNYYRNTLALMVKNSQEIEENSKLILDPYDIYSHIIFATKNFKQNILSLDCDISAWYYICENEDFDEIIKQLDNEDKIKEIELIKGSYINEYKERRRIDLTYNISNILLCRKEKDELRGMKSVKRVFILDKNKIDIKILIILVALQRINKTTRKTICNHYIFLDEIDQTTKKAIEKVQDIIIFDDSIAYQEYTLKDSNGTSTVITEKETINNQKKQFELIFKSAQEVNINSILKKLEEGRK